MGRINNFFSKIIFTISILLFMISSILSQSDKLTTDNEKKCLVENFKNSKLKVAKENCFAIDSSCCHMSFDYQMGSNNFSNSYCFLMKKKNTVTNITDAQTTMYNNIWRELVWFANWTTNSFGIYSTIGRNYAGNSPIPTNPLCVPPVFRPPKTVYCPDGYGNSSTFDVERNCTQVVMIDQWTKSPAINNIAKVFYDLYLTPALFNPPCKNITPVEINVTCPLNYNARSRMLEGILFVLFSVLLILI